MNDARQSAAPTSAHAWAVLVLAGVTIALTGINLSVMYVVYPEIQEAFPDVSGGQTSWILNGFTIVAAATLVIAGVMSDHWGRKRVVLAGCASFVAGSVVCALASNVATIVAGRAVIGVASSLVTTAAIALAMREFPPERRGTAFGVLATFGGLASAAGPSLGSIIVELGGWRWAFWINVPFAVVALVFGARVFDESRDPAAHRLPDPLSALLLLVGVGIGVLAVVQSPSWHWGSARTIACLVAAVVLITALLLRSARHPAPIIDLRLFRSRNVGLFNFIALVVGVGWFAMYLMVILFLRQTWDYGLLDAGLLVTPIPLGAATLGLVGGRLADSVGFRPMLLVGSCAFAFGAIWFVTMVGTDPDVSAWLVGIIAMGVGTGLTIPSFQAGAIIGTPPERYAIAAGLNQTLQRVGAAIGTAIAVAFVESVGLNRAFDRVMLIFFFGSVVTAIAAVALSPGALKSRDNVAQNATT